MVPIDNKKSGERPAASSLTALVDSEETTGGGRPAASSLTALVDSEETTD